MVLAFQLRRLEPKINYTHPFFPKKTKSSFLKIPWPCPAVTRFVICSQGDQMVLAWRRQLFAENSQFWLSKFGSLKNIAKIEKKVANARVLSFFAKILLEILQSYLFSNNKSTNPLIFAEGLVKTHRFLAFLVVQNLKLSRHPQQQTQFDVQKALRKAIFNELSSHFK